MFGRYAAGASTMASSLSISASASWLEYPLAEDTRTATYQRTLLEPPMPGESSAVTARGETRTATYTS
jgi:hypothetical protein